MLVVCPQGLTRIGSLGYGVREKNLLLFNREVWGPEYTVKCRGEVLFLRGFFHFISRTGKIYQNRRKLFELAKKLSGSPRVREEDYAVKETAKIDFQISLISPCSVRFRTNNLRK
jgi:hypothetical protein